MIVRWRTADGALTRLRVEEYDRRYLMNLVRAAVVWDCVGARLVKIGHVLGSRSMIGIT